MDEDYEGFIKLIEHKLVRDLAWACFSPLLYCCHAVDDVFLNTTLHHEYSNCELKGDLQTHFQGDKSVCVTCICEKENNLFSSNFQLSVERKKLIFQLDKNPLPPIDFFTSKLLNPNVCQRIRLIEF